MTSFWWDHFSCKYCTTCIFCSQNCLELSWNDFHQWECAGLQTDLFYETGIAFPAFKAILKGLTSQFKDNSYKNFDKLITHFEDIQNTLPLLIVNFIRCLIRNITYTFFLVVIYFSFVFKILHWLFYTARQGFWKDYWCKDRSAHVAIIV